MIPAVLTPFVILLMTCCKIESSAPLSLERILSIRLSWFFDFLVFVCRLSSKFCSLSGVRSSVRLKSHLQSCLVSLREALASWQSTVSGFLACWLPRSLHSLATTMDILCAIFCHCEAKPKQSNVFERPTRLVAALAMLAAMTCPCAIASIRKNARQSTVYECLTRLIATRPNGRSQ